MTKAHTKTPDFEQSLTQLNQLVEKMETGKLSLEESMQHFEQGVSLIRSCQQALTQAEQKVRILTEQHTLEPYSNESYD